VLFEDSGTLTGWDNYPQHPQQKGVLRTVAAPRFKGRTAIEARQTYVASDGDGYHSETVKFGAERVGEDLYFGQAIYLAKNWKFHAQNVTFQQFSPEKPEGPWLLMFVQGDEIRFGGSSGISGTVGKITNLRGTWIRVVVRIHMAPAGHFEVWVNGDKKYSTTGDFSTGFAGNSSIRWSTGLYAGHWQNDKPAGQSDLSIWHDHARVALSYDAAEPASWHE
jgi:hypothetical protein